MRLAGEVQFRETSQASGGDWPCRFFSLRAKVDSQIQRYVVIKTAISALQGLLVYLVMARGGCRRLSDLFTYILFLPALQGYFLNVRMSHLFAVAHFLLNYIPTVIACLPPLRHNALPQPEVVFVVQAGPIIATVLPMPVVVLDPDLSVAAKVAAFAGEGPLGGGI